MPKIHAQLSPHTERKYYGTEICLSTETGGEAYITVWVNGVTDYKPSDRALEGFKAGIAANGDNPDDYEYEICDDHYETQGAYLISQKIVEALNGMEI